MTLASVGALLSVALGLLGLLRPEAAAKLVSISALGPVGRSEIRATYGGLFIGLGLACLLVPQPAAWLTAGSAWAGAALARTMSMLIDGSRDPKNMGGIALEGAIAALLLSGAGGATGN